MEEGKFLSWLKNDGDFVQEGEPLFALESDKAAQEVESIDRGILRIPITTPRPGDIVKVGQVLGYLLAEGETAPATESPAPALAATPPPQKAAATSAPTPAPIALPTPAKASATEMPLRASPRARRAAAQHGIELATVPPGGSTGRIRERDVLSALPEVEPGIAKDGFTKLPVTPLRRTIAARLMHSRQTTVPVTLTTRCEADTLLGFRKQLKAEAETAHLAIVPSLNDLLVKLTAAALKSHRMLAATWSDDALLLPETTHLGIAVDTPTGLVVPVIRNADTSTLTEIALQSQKLIAAARAGQLAGSDMQGACFTLSNLGSFGIEAFTPVINPPESAILGIGTVVREAVPLEGGSFAARQRLTLSLTFDHRVNDGAAAARFLQTLTHLIEHPLLALV